MIDSTGLFVLYLGQQAAASLKHTTPGMSLSIQQFVCCTIWDSSLQPQKAVYIDGHAREDVVKYHEFVN